MRLQISQLLAQAEENPDLPQLEELLKRGETLQQILGVSQESLDELYAASFRAYEKQDLLHARRGFAFLTLLAPDRKKYWKALATCQVASELFKDALYSYQILALLDPDDSKAWLYGSYCQWKMGAASEAHVTFQKAQQLRK